MCPWCRAGTLDEGLRKAFTAHAATFHYPGENRMSGFTAVLLYIVWTLILAVVYASYRLPMIFSGKKPANHWERGNPVDDPAILVRAKSAHLNCLENFPLFAAVVFVAAFLSKSAVVDAVAAYVLYLRVAQSLVHLVGTSLPLVLLRATLYIAQVLLILYVAWELLH
jgi:uncharacterized MAPEG superfamily protein